ncbi:MAG: ribosome maturation factor RimP [Polyangiaceae bacterium]
MQSNSTDKSVIVKGGVDLAKVRDAIAPVLVAHGVDLVELTWATDQGGWTLRLTIERVPPPGTEAAPTAETNFGVTLEDCVDVSRDVSQLLDVEDLIAQHYNLEVSSPGLDRKLRGPADYVRFRGQLAKVKLSKPAADGQRVLRGTLEEAEDGHIGVRVDGKLLRAPFEDIEDARLVFELQTGEKKGQSKGGKKGKSPAEKTAATKAGGDAARGAAAGNQDRRGPNK